MRLQKVRRQSRADATRLPRLVPHPSQAEGGTADPPESGKTFTCDRSTGRDSSGSPGNTLPGTGERPTIAAGPLATLLCCGGFPLFLFFPPPCCETAMPENEVGDHYCLLAARSAPHWLNTGDLVQRCRLEPHPRVGPVRAIRDRLRYRFRSQPIIENYQACGLRARLLPPSRSPRRA